MNAVETTGATWECPECNCVNQEFLFEGESLPEILQCSFCNHKSEPIEWKIEKELK